MLAVAGPARGAPAISRPAGTTRRKRRRGSRPARRVIADAKITGDPKAAAYWYLGDSLLKKRDYDGAIAAFNKAHEPIPKMSTLSTRAASPTATRATTSARWPISISCLQLRPNFPRAYNNRGLIFLRRGDLQRALDEFNAAIKLNCDDRPLYQSLQSRAGADPAQAI